MAGPADVYQQLRQAYAAADAEGAAALYAPDAVYYEPDNTAHTGRDEIRRRLGAYFTNRGPVEIIVKREVTTEDTVLAEYTMAFTEGGRRWSGIPGVSVLELGRDGIVYQRDYA